MTAERSDRFALTGHDPEGRNRTIILWQEADLVDGIVARRVVVTLDATMTPRRCSRACRSRRGGAGAAGRCHVITITDVGRTRYAQLSSAARYH